LAATLAHLAALSKAAESAGADRIAQVVPELQRWLTDDPGQEPMQILNDGLQDFGRAA